MELAQQLRNEIMGYFGAASDFDDKLAKQLKLSRTEEASAVLLRLQKVSASSQAPRPLSGLI